MSLIQQVMMNIHYVLHVVQCVSVSQKNLPSNLKTHLIENM